VVDLEAALLEHLLKVTVSERSEDARRPSGRSIKLEMSPFEINVRLALQLLGNGIQNHGDAPQIGAGISPVFVNVPLTMEICDTPDTNLQPPRSS